MKRKAAIITWCYDNGCSNYGQILQCYAMQCICNKLELSPLVIKYRSRTETEVIKRRFPIAYLNYLYEKRFIIREVEKTYNKRIELFFQFIEKQIQLSNPCYSKKDIEQETADCDILLCGSDQIWNPMWFTPIYALDFGTDQQKRIAYAPSGIALEDTFSKKKYRELAGYLERFHAISVREKIGTDLLKKYTEKEVIDVLDPTFLLSTEDWDTVAAEKLVEEPYIFCYTLAGLRPYKLILKRLMKRYGAVKVIYIPSNLIESGYIDSRDFEKSEAVGPAEFLSLIKHARLVCSDSFHGMALSINYRKQFCITERAQRGSAAIANEARKDNILEMLHLEKRKVSSVKDVEELEDIDYTQVDQYLENNKKKSWEFLKNSI